MKYGDVWMLALGASSALIGCSSKEDVKPTPYVGSIELAVSLPSSHTFAEVGYTLKRVGGYEKSGMLMRQAGETTLEASIDSVPIGTNYQLQVDAAASDDGSDCTASTHFDISSHQVVMTRLYVRCPGDQPSDAGVSSVDAGDDACPVINTITPAIASDGVSVSLRVDADDPDDGPAPLTYAWSTTGGMLSNPDSASPTLKCPSAGGDLTITVTVSDSVCADHKTLLVQCRRADGSNPTGNGTCQEDTASASLDPTSADSQAVAYQIDAQHSGSQPNDTLSLPLAVRWTHDFAEGGVSYPLVASGRVFVTVAHRSSTGTALYALDTANGGVVWGPVELSGSFFWSAATYEAGRVFAVNGDGLLAAYAADSGSQAWVTQLPGTSDYSSAPTAFGGRVYAGGGGKLQAVNADDGKVLWSAAVENGDDSSPAVGQDGVFVSYACNQAYGFSLACGTALWHHTSDCEGGGGKTVALLDDRVYTRDSGGDLVLDATSGTLVGSFSSKVIPAGANGVLYTLTDGKLTARAAGAATPLWTFGDGTLISAPLRVGKNVVVGSMSGVVSVLSANDGSLVSSYKLSAAVAAPDEQNVSAPLSGMAAAGNQLYVPSGTSLTAF